jgi:malate dehydrogenase (oxaloacetate-decarboxylating)
VINGVGAAGTAITRLLVLAGARHIIGFDRTGAIHSGRTAPNAMREWFMANTNQEGFTGTLEEAMHGADVFIGVSSPNVLSEAGVAAMAPDGIVFALANPDPEIDPQIAQKYVRIIATGRSDYPNQINNVLAFPGLFRGLLDAGAKKITDELLVAAAHAIASCVHDDMINESYIVPSVFDPNVAKTVAAAVRKVAEEQL